MKVDTVSSIFLPLQSELWIVSDKIINDGRDFPRLNVSPISALRAT